MMRNYCLLFIAFLLVKVGQSQVVYEDISNSGIYEFLDEIANDGVITLNAVIKPYSREFIAGKLLEAKVQDEAAMHGDTLAGVSGMRHRQLTARQRKELHFYLQDYQIELKDTEWQFDYKLEFIARNKPEMALALNPLGYFYHDKLFTFSVRPILGFEVAVNGNGSAYHRFWGGSIFGYIGKNFGFYANLRDLNESEALALPAYFNQAQGAVYKYNSDSTVDFSEMRGGVNISWKWGSFGLMKDRISWGNNYHGANILSAKAPSFPYLQLHLNPVKWFEFQYIHAWLNSDVIDSSRSYYNGNVYRVVYRNKFFAANMFTFKPWKELNLSLGNSIVYADDGVQPVFLIPFLFFNSVDATSSSYENDAGSNSQFFIDISSRQIRHLNLYMTLFVDELMMSRVTDPGSLNWTSWKAGFRLSDFPLRNLSLTGEWTKTNPITYKHYIATTTFASNNYCMGHYLRDNSMELYAAVTYKPLRGLSFNLDYMLARHGDEYPDDRSYSYDSLRFMDNITWEDQSIGLTARYEFVNNGYFTLRYLYSARKGENRYQPDFMRGNTHSFSLGLNVGF